MIKSSCRTGCLWVRVKLEKLTPVWARSYDVCNIPNRMFKRIQLPNFGLLLDSTSLPDLKMKLNFVVVFVFFLNFLTNSASYKYKDKFADSGSQLMWLLVCQLSAEETYPSNSTTMLSIKNQIMLTVCLSKYFLLDSGFLHIYIHLCNYCKEIICQTNHYKFVVVVKLGQSKVSMLFIKILHHDM